jgi:hypothetical protein
LSNKTLSFGTSVRVPDAESLLRKEKKSQKDRPRTLKYEVQTFLKVNSSQSVNPVCGADTEKTYS